MKHPFKVQVFKRDGKPHYSWDTNCLYRDDSFLCTYMKAPRALQHTTKGKTFYFETHAMEWFWVGLPFSIGLSFHPQHHTIGFYCNIHEPVHLSPDTLSFIDLDLDVVRPHDASTFEIVDGDEFDEHQKLYNYPRSYLTLVPAIAQQLKFELEQRAELKAEVLKQELCAAFQNECPQAPLPFKELNTIRELFKQWPTSLNFNPEELFEKKRP
jgi:protein associated with RNAse G/E